MQRTTSSSLTPPTLLMDYGLCTSGGSREGILFQRSMMLFPSAKEYNLCSFANTSRRRRRVWDSLTLSSSSLQRLGPTILIMVWLAAHGPFLNSLPSSWLRKNNLIRPSHLPFLFSYRLPQSRASQTRKEERRWPEKEVPNKIDPDLASACLLACLGAWDGMDIVI